MPIFNFTGYTPTELFRKTDIWLRIYEQTSSTFYTSNNVSLKRVEKKKLLGPNNKDISLNICWGSHHCRVAV